MLMAVHSTDLISNRGTRRLSRYENLVRDSSGTDGGQLRFEATLFHAAVALWEDGMLPSVLLCSSVLLSSFRPDNPYLPDSYRPFVTGKSVLETSKVPLTRPVPRLLEKERHK